MKDTIYYQQGLNAGLCGKTLDDCKYRLHERRIAWVRGFHEGKLLRDKKTLSSDQVTIGKLNIASLREKLINYN